MRKLFAYLKGLFSSTPAEKVETTAGEEIKAESQITDAVTQAPTQEIEERLAEVAKDEKIVTAKEIKAKAKKKSPATPKAEIEIDKESVKKPARRRPAKKTTPKKED
jgi:preprotein translocase subunit YajC